jgi:hypothetical protein
MRALSGSTYLAVATDVSLVGTDASRGEAVEHMATMGGPRLGKPRR